jgi:hypothetical protein
VTDSAIYGWWSRWNRISITVVHLGSNPVELLVGASYCTSLGHRCLYQRSLGMRKPYSEIVKGTNRSYKVKVITLWFCYIMYYMYNAFYSSHWYFSKNCLTRCYVLFWNLLIKLWVHRIDNCLSCDIYSPSRGLTLNLFPATYKTCLFYSWSTIRWRNIWGGWLRRT